MKKLLAIILSITMVLGCMSTTAFAATLSGSNNTISSNGTYEVTGNVYASSSGNGNALTIGSGVNATVTLSGGQVYAKGKTYCAIYNYGTLTFNGNSNKPLYSYTGGSGRPVVNYGNLKIGEGTKVYASIYDSPSTVSVGSTAISNYEGATLDVNGTIIAGHIDNSGTIKSNLTSGYFYDDMSDYVADGYECVESDDYTGCRYTVQKETPKPDMYIANGVGYSTAKKLNEAIANGTITESTPITFTSDVKNGTLKINKPIVVDTDTKIAIDLESSEVTLKSSSTDFLKMTAGNVTLKNGTVKCESLSDSPFACSGGEFKVENVAIGDSATICSYAFSGCSALTSIDIPESITSIGSNAFYGVTATVNYAGYNTSELIGNYGGSLDWKCAKTDYRCGDNLTWSYDEESGKLTISGTGKMNAYDSFATTPWKFVTGIKEVVIEEGVTSIGKAFSGCEGLIRIKIPSSVTNIGEHAFSGCSGLTSIEIPSGVTSIGYSAFSGCSGLTSIKIPDGVTSIDSIAFYNVTAIVYYDGYSDSPIIGNYGGNLTWKIASIDSASVSVAEDITVRIFAELPSEDSDGFSITATGDAGAEATLTKAKYDETTGLYEFDLIVIPSQMSETFTISLMHDDVKVSTKKFSIKSYCDTIANDANYSSDEKLMKLLASILSYGEALQKYNHYNESNLATSGLDWVSSHTPEYQSATSAYKKDGTGDAGAYIKSGRLFLSNKIDILFTIDANDATGLTTKIFRNNNMIKEAVVTEGKYEIDTGYIAPYRYDDVYEIAIYRNGDEIQRITYSVGTYISNQVAKNSNQTLVDVCKSIWVYGEAVKAYNS